MLRFVRRSPGAPRTATPFIGAALALLTVAPLASAQGRVVPRPCPLPACGAPAPIERTRSDVRVTLEGRVLRYEVRETFVNRGGGLGEADYLFPLPRDAAFRDFSLTIGGEPVMGEVMDAAQARAIYENIVRQQRDPALVEWMGQGMLRARIFPLPSGEPRDIVVRFDAVLPRDGDALRIAYTTGRPNTARDPGIPIRRPGMPDDDIAAAGGATSFALTYDPATVSGRPYSPTHRLDVRVRGSRREVQARGTGHDVVILLPSATPERGAIGALAHRPLPDEPGFALFTVSAPAVRPASLPRDVTFVVDVSGSMRGVKMEQARAAGHRLLATLDRRDRFRIIAFSSDVRAYRQDFTLASPSALREAGAFIDALAAEGGTNIAGALEEALAVSSPAGRLPLVLFMTDGEATVGERRPDAIAESAAAHRGRARVFTLGLGADVNVGLIERLALHGRGTAQFVAPAENVESAVAALAARLTNPVVTDVVLRASGIDLANAMPQGPQDLFAGQELVLLARYRSSAGAATVTVEGQGADGPVRWTTRVRFPDRERENGFVARLWATQRLGWLAAERRLRGGSPELDDEIRTLGTRYGIPTELTSYLVLEPGMVVTQAAAAPMRASQATQLSASSTLQRGFEGSAASDAKQVAPGTASFDQARTAASQRARTTLAEEHPATERGGQRIGSRVFVRGSDDVWSDGTPVPEVGSTETRRRIRVAPYSPAWFEVIDRVPDLGEVFALGERIRVSGRTAMLEVGPGGAHQLTPADRAVLGGW